MFERMLIAGYFNSVYMHNSPFIIIILFFLF